MAQNLRTNFEEASMNDDPNSNETDEVKLCRPHKTT